MASSDYTLPSDLVKEFTPKEVSDMIQQFKVFDGDGDGVISRPELAVVLQNLGENVTEARLNELLAEVDRNNDNVIDFGEFAHVSFILTKI